VSIPEPSALHNGERAAALVMFRVISRRHWNQLQSWHQAYPGCTVEHLEAGLYVLVIPAGGVREAAA
jgi:hypothetical protein